MTNKKPHKVSPTFIIMIVVFIALLSYFCYNLVSQTGLIPIKTENTLELVDTNQVDTNQLKLAEKDSIITLKDKEIIKLKEELAKGPDTVYIKLKPIVKKIDSLVKSTQFIKSDSSD